MAGGAVDRVVSQLLTELDTLDEYSEVTVLGATNRPDLVDPALLSPRRFAYVVELAMPDEAARREILTAQTRKMPLADDVDLDLLAKLLGGDERRRPGLVVPASGAQRDPRGHRRRASDGQRAIGVGGGLRVNMRTLEEALMEVPSAGVTARTQHDGTAAGHGTPSAVTGRPAGLAMAALRPGPTTGGPDARARYGCWRGGLASRSSTCSSAGSPSRRREVEPGYGTVVQRADAQELERDPAHRVSALADA